MTLTIDDVVTHYIFSSHPRNHAIVDIKNKKTGELRYIKIRHRLSKFYAASVVDPVTFEVWAETQVKSASARVKPIILHLGEENNNNKDPPAVELRDTSRIGFEWSFIWEGEKYRWVRESRMSNSLECRAVRKTGDICVAQYLPRTLQDEYFGIFSLLGYNMLRCNLTKSRELELIILMSLMTLLDKSNDGGWKRDAISKVQDEVGVYNNNNVVSSNCDNKDNDDSVPRIAYEDPIPKKAQQKKYKVEALNDQKLQLMLEKDVKRSQKQIQSDQKTEPLSAGNSPNHTPKGSPLPTPSTSINIGGGGGIFTSSPRLLPRQKSTGHLNYYSTTNTANSPNISIDSAITPISPTSSGSSSGGGVGGKLSRIFSTLSHIKQTDGVLSTTLIDSEKSSHVDTNNKHICNKFNDSITLTNNGNNAGGIIISQNEDYAAADPKRYQKKKQQQKLSQYDSNQYEVSSISYCDDDQHAFTTGQLLRITANDFGRLSMNSRSSSQQDLPMSLRNIRWNLEPLSPIQTNTVTAVNTNKHNNTQQQRSSTTRQQRIPTQQLHSRSNSQGRRRPSAATLEEHQRRLSFSEYPLYAYNHPQHPHYAYSNILPQQHPQQQIQSNTYNYNRYSTSEYYTYQQQQQHDYYHQ